MGKLVTAVSQKYTDQFRHWCKQTGQGVLEMARIAADVRDAYGYAPYIEWLAAEFGLAARTGDRLLSVHKNLLSTANLAVDYLDQIAPSALYLLASDETPPEVRTEMVEVAKGGEKVTHKAVKAALPKKNKKPAAAAPVTKAAETSTEPPPVQVFYDEPPAPTKAKPAHAPEPKPAPVPKAPVTTDEEGNAIHRMELVEVFGRRDEFGELLRAVSTVKSKVLAGIKDEDELYRFIDPTRFRADCENLYRVLKFGIPHALCPYHADDALARRGCKCCGGSGWVPKDKYDQAPASMKKGVRR